MGGKELLLWREARVGFVHFFQPGGIAFWSVDCGGRAGFEAGAGAWADGGGWRAGI